MSERRSVPPSVPPALLRRQLAFTLLVPLGFMLVGTVATWLHDSESRAAIGRYSTSYLALAVGYQLTTLMWAGLALWILRAGRIPARLGDAADWLIARSALFWGGLALAWMAYAAFWLTTGADILLLSARIAPAVALGTATAWLLACARTRYSALDRLLHRITDAAHREVAISLPWRRREPAVSYGLLGGGLALLAASALAGGFFGGGVGGTLVALIIAALIPGWAIGRALGLHAVVPRPGRVPLWFTLGVGALEAAAGLSRLAGVHVRFALLALAVGGAGLLAVTARREWRRETPAAPALITVRPPTLLLALAALLGAVGMLVIAGRLAVYTIDPSRDTWLYASYADWYLRHPGEPIIARNVFSGLHPRNLTNGWLFANAALSWMQPIAPVRLISITLTPALTLAGLGAVFFLGYAATGWDLDAGLLAVIMTAFGHASALIIEYPYIRYHTLHQFFLRDLSQDKAVAFFVLLPVALGLAAAYRRQGDRRLLAPLTGAVLTLALTHAMGTAGYVLALTGFGLVRLLLTPREVALRRWAALTLIAAPVVVISGLQGAESGGGLPTAGGLPPLAALFVQPGVVRLVSAALSPPLQIGTRVVELWLLTLTPFLVPAIIVCAALLAVRRRDPAVQMFAGLTFPPLLLLFVPGLYGLFTGIIRPAVAWRFLWTIPFGLILAMGMLTVVRYAAKPLRLYRLQTGRLLLAAALLAGCALYVPHLAHVLPAHRADLLDSAPTAADWEVIGWLDAQDDDRATVLAPLRLNGMIYGSGAMRVLYTFNAAHYDLSDQPAQSWATWIEAFYDGTLPDSPEQRRRFAALLRTYEVGYLVMPRDNPLDAAWVEGASGDFTAIAQNAAYTLYRVERPLTWPD
jgi:hypothetical protein